MLTRARLVGLLLLVAVASASFATCGHDETTPSVDSPPEPRATRIDAHSPGAPRVARERRHAQPAIAEPQPQERLARLGDDLSIDVSSESSSPIEAVRTSPVEPTGRVRVLLLKDGRPFDGGHVCFYPAEKYAVARAWDGSTWSDRAASGVPLYTPFWPNFEAVLGSADGAQRDEERARGITGSDGVVTLDVRANRSLVPYVRYAAGGIPLVSQPRVFVAAGGETTLTIEAAPMRVLTGRCADTDGRPLAGIWVQAIAPGEERPLSRMAETSAQGAFQLEVWGKDHDVRVRAVVPYVVHPLAICDDESQIPAIPAETTIPGVVPGAGALEIRMPAAPVVLVELTTAAGEPPLTHLQIEGLVFDSGACAWGRLGGPQYRRVATSAAARRAVVALPAADAARPLLVWSSGRTMTATDVRGAEHATVEIPRGRPVSLRGRGWRETDRLRVVCSLGSGGIELPCIWIDAVLGNTDHWSRDDAPGGVIEFQIIRGGVVAGRSRVPAGSGPAAEASIDLE